MSIFHEAKKEFIKTYEECPLCRWPTRSISNTHERECIACDWYLYTPPEASEKNVLNSNAYAKRYWTSWL